MTLTLDAAMNKVTEKIDEILQERWYSLGQRLIEDSGDAKGVLEEGAWNWLSSSWIWQHQRELDLEWRAKTLAQLREQLSSEFR
jgi:hypothetical protein